MYSKSKILLLDDPLSALDHTTAQSIVQKCFSKNRMHSKIVVLVTHRTHLVHHLGDQFIELSGGEVKVSTDDPFLSNGGLALSEELKDVESVEPELKSQKVLDGDTPGNFIEEEHREHGGVKAKVWLTFVKAGKWWWALLAAMMALTRVFNISQKWFFKSWGEAYGEEDAANLWSLNHTGHQFNAEWTSFQQSNKMFTFLSFDPIDYLPPPSEDLRPWLLILLVISIGQSLSLLAYGCSQLIAVYATSKKMFADVMVRITNASFRFYDVTPAGRLMNRLTSDIQVLDDALSYFGSTIFYGSLWISSVLVIALISPVFLFFSAALMFLFVFVFFQFLPTSRSLKRLETVSLSPLFTNFGELLQAQGLTTVRAFQAQEPFQNGIIAVVDQLQGLSHFYWSVQNWLMWRYENISALATFALTAIALLVDLSPGMTAFMLLNAAGFIQSTHTLCIRFGELQTEFISVERVVELLDVEQEPAGTIRPPASWPRFGSDIHFDNVTIRYAPHLNPSLTGISLHIPGGSTTAIIGRTGSGKSTLAAALLNIVRAESGVITIDNIALTDIDVKSLRKHITFVPQDPVLFPGTIRHNLDPLNDFSDEECESVLARVCADADQAWTLNTQVSSGGHNFSQGQRQLVGITRAVLRRSPIVILDEATASIDTETSMGLQKILRTEMKESTVITIAHRVEAVNDADYSVVLENGQVLSQGPLQNGVRLETED